jgi:alkylhydroperoxidase family enzyme
MPTLAPLTDAQASDAAKPLFQALQAKFRMVPNIFRTMGSAPAVLKATLDLNAAIHSDLPPKLRELAYLKCSLLNACEY